MAIRFVRLGETEKYLCGCSDCVLRVGLDLATMTDEPKAERETFAWEACWRGLAKRCPHVKRSERPELEVVVGDPWQAHG